MPAELLRGDPDVSDDSPNEILNLSDAQNDAINTIISAPPVAAGPAEPQAGAPAAHTADQFPAKNAQQLFTKFVLDSAGKEADNHVSRATDKNSSDGIPQSVRTGFC